MGTIRIGLIGDFDPSVVAHRAIPEALALAAGQLGRRVEATWVHTATIGKDVLARLADFAGLWCVPASPYASTEGALAAIRLARETCVPFLGTCGGFQHALLEYARNVLGHPEAEHAETCPDAPMPLISRLSCSLVGRTGTVTFREGSRLKGIYGAPQAEEPYHCNYGLNPGYEDLLAGTALRVSARDEAGEVRAVELEAHPFFIATLFQPERAALWGVAHPLVNACVAAAAARADAPSQGIPAGS
jgi:CTP synthase (UTP-ammonia lyase)